MVERLNTAFQIQTIQGFCSLGKLKLPLLGPNAIFLCTILTMVASDEIGVGFCRVVEEEADGFSQLSGR
jgi:hypothetical protein